MSEMKSRRRARELALKGLYQWLLSANSAATIADHLSSEIDDFAKADKDFFMQLLQGSIENAETLENEFAPCIHRTVAELSPVERAVLMLATYEFLYMIETPYRVVINEAIELTKKYGGTAGHRFVNGALDKLAARLRAIETENNSEVEKEPPAVLE